MRRFSAIEYWRRLGFSGDTGNAGSMVTGTEVLMAPLAVSSIQNDLPHLLYPDGHNRTLTRYRTLCFDMSGNFENYSLEFMHESRRVFLVCTPEPAALYLAREKYSYLSDLDLADRVVVIMNRWPKKTEMQLQQIEQELGLPIFATLTNDYNGVQEAITQGCSIEPTSGLGKEFTMLAKNILSNEANAWRIGQP